MGLSVIRPSMFGNILLCALLVCIYASLTCPNHVVTSKVDSHQNRFELQVRRKRFQSVLLLQVLQFAVSRLSYLVDELYDQRLLGVQCRVQQHG